MNLNPEMDDGVAGVDEEKYCRLCLEQRIVYFSLFEHKAAEMLESLTSIKVSSSDSLSVLVCSKCLVDLKTAYSTQQRLIQIQSRFQEKISNIKRELSDWTNELVKPVQDFKTVNSGCTFEEKLSRKLFNIKKKMEECENASVKSINSISNEIVFVDVKPDQEEIDIKPETNLLAETVISDDFECNMCPEKCQNLSDFVLHLQTHSVINCKVCYRDVFVDEIKTHRRAHLSGFCDYCGVTLKSKDSLRRHVRFYHAEPKVLCEDCGIFLSNCKAHDIHMRKMHTGKASHICDTCGRKFFSSNELCYHVRVKHAQRKPFVCDVCNKRFVRKWTWQAHKLKHTKEKRFVCEFCGKGFKYRISLRTHQRTVHDCPFEDSHKCVDCGKGFPSHFSLVSHWKIHRK